MGATAILIGKENGYLFTGFPFFRIFIIKHKPYVIGIDNGKIAFASCYCFYLISVASLGVPSHIGEAASCPLFRCFCPISGYYRGKQGLIVYVFRRAGKDFPFPFVRNKIFISTQPFWIDTILTVGDNPRPIC